MAIDTVPSPTLDSRNSDQITAEAVSSLPAELSDHSASNAAVVIIEATGVQLDQDLFQVNNWPQAVIQKALALVGVTLNSATAATVQQTFTLSAPQSSDTIVPAGTQFANADGSLVFSTLSDLTITAYKTGTGTVYINSGSTTLNGTGTTFTADLQVGYQLSVDKSTWYTVASIGSDSVATLTSSYAGATISSGAAVAYYVGAVTGTVSAQCTTTGLATNAAAGSLTSLQTQPAGVASTTNAAAAAGGADEETTANAIARAPQAFASRDIACTASDYGYFATKILGVGGRAIAQVNTNNTTAVNGYVTIAMLSPAWTTSTAVTAQERANVIRDANGRSFAGATLVDVAANIQTFTTAGSGSSTGTMFACAVYRRAAYDSTSSRIAIAGAINTYLSPNTYTWGRSIYPGDLVGQIEALQQIDRVANINGVLAVGMNYTVVANNVSFTNGSTTATGTAGDFTNMTANQTFLMDQTNGAVYLVTNVSSGTLTITPAYTGPTGTLKPGWFTATHKALTNWYSLPFSNLSVSSASPPVSVLVVGSV